LLNWFQVSELYKRHALGQLKKEFRHTAVITINKVFNENSGNDGFSLRPVLAGD
jgi:hypothetical protein